MGLLTKYEARADGMKMATFTPKPGFLDTPLASTSYPYSRKVGRGTRANVVMSPVSWVMRNFTEAEPLVRRRTGGDWDYVDDHPLEILIDEPNKVYDGDTLLKAAVMSYVLDGNAYWLKLRNAFGGVVELWYLPHFLVEPMGPDTDTGRGVITHYEYRTSFFGSSDREIEPRDIVHLRYGTDPDHPRKGFSTLKTLLREIYTDEESANFSASIMRNMGVPGGMIAPKDHQSLPRPEDVEKMKKHMTEGFVGDKRGQWLVLGTPTTVEQFGFDPNTLNVASLRDIAEERVCAAIGIPAAVVGFGAGLQQTKVGATMKELRKSAWENCIIPMQTTIARQVTRQLMPDFQSQTRRFQLAFDTRHVSAVGAEETEVAERASTLLGAGILTRTEAREMVGYPPDEMGDELPEPKLPEPSRNGTRPPPEDETQETVNRARAVLEAMEVKG
ncbi:MAG: phage portal protein [Acidobacteriota bacterium]|nr:phage portal protein [Acidobacteriota bacterium]